MRSELIQLYRKASPRTGRGTEYRWVPRKQLKKHLAAGWKRKVEKKPEAVSERIEPEPEPEPESGEESDEPPNKLSFKDFTDPEKMAIKRSRKPMSLLAEIHNTTLYCIRKIKGKV